MGDEKGEPHGVPINAEAPLAPLAIGSENSPSIGSRIGAWVGNWLQGRLRHWWDTASDGVKGFLLAVVTCAIFGGGYISLDRLFNTEIFTGIERGIALPKNQQCSAKSDQDVDKIIKLTNHSSQRHIWEIKSDNSTFIGTQRVERESEKDANVVTGLLSKKSAFLGSMISPNAKAVYFLTWDNNGFFRGKQIAKDCDVGAIIVCPYALGPQEKSDDMQKWSDTSGPCERFKGNWMF